MSEINSAYIYVPDPSTSRALFNADLYYGIPDTDPTIGANQKLVKGIQEDGSTVSLPQPIKTNSGGVPEYNGSPIRLDVTGDYSFTALDRLGAQKYHAPNVDNPEPGSDMFSGIVIEEVNSLIVGQTTVTLATVGANESVHYLQTSTGDQGFLAKDIDYTITNSTTIELTQSYNAGDRVISRQNDPAGQLFTNPSIDRLLTFDTVADAITNEALLSVGDYISINRNSSGESIGWRYQVVTLAGVPDNYNEIQLSGSKMIRLLTIHSRLQTYSEAANTPVINVGVFDLDMKNGTVFSVSLTENVTNITFSNINTGSGMSISLTLRLIQDGTGGRTINWPASILWAGGVAPTVTTTANAEDWYGLSTLDGGTTWYGYSLGADFS